jgi:hypothetical protein
MAKIGQQPPRAPLWPWGGPRSIREKLVDPTQLDRKARKKGDPKNPALASAALLESIGPANSAEELRLPMPALPGGHDADVEGYADRPHLSSVAERMNEARREALERGLASIRAPADRVERLKSLLSREASMLDLVGRVSQEMSEVERRRREESAGEDA